MGPIGIWNKVKNILETDPGLRYLKKVYEGMREIEGKVAIQAPCVIMEPVSNSETNEGSSWPKVDPTFEIALVGLIKSLSEDMQVVAQNPQAKGVLNLEKDIKIAIGGHEQLDCEANSFSFPNTVYDFSEYPKRWVVITLAVKYRQDFKTRE